MRNSKLISKCTNLSSESLDFGDTKISVSELQRIHREPVFEMKIFGVQSC